MQLRATWRQKWPRRNNKSSGSAPSRRQPRRDARRCNIYHILLPKLELRGTVRLAWQPPLKNFKHALTHELSSSSRSLLGLFHQKYIVCWSKNNLLCAWIFLLRVFTPFYEFMAALILPKPHDSRVSAICHWIQVINLFKSAMIRSLQAQTLSIRWAIVQSLQLVSFWLLRTRRFE